MICPLAAVCVLCDLQGTPCEYYFFAELQSLQITMGSTAI